MLDNICTCANCGKEGNSDEMNTCNKCKEVKYCNAACKKKHRTKHKKACERRVAELYDEKLFKEPPPREECPICLLPLSHQVDASNFMACCGKTICHGCIYAMQLSEGKDLCPFCRTPDASTDEENIKRLKELIYKGNAEACNMFAGAYYRGIYGLPQDYRKANELFLKAGELGCAEGYYNLGNSYYHGRGVQMDKKKAKYYFDLAAIGGSILSRNNLGVLEGEVGNHHRAMKHFAMAAKAGDKYALENIKIGFTHRFVTKDEYATTLRAHHERQKEIKSDSRDKADLFLAAR